MTKKKVSLFVVVFDKPDRRLVKITSFEKEDAALEALFAAEDEYLTVSPNRYEVVLLGAESLDDLRKTHSRYFATGKIDDHLVAI